MAALSPLLLPSSDYSFTSKLSASESFSFSESATLEGVGQLRGSVSVSFTQSGNIGSGSILGSAGLTFSEVGTLTGTGELQGSTGITFTASLAPPADPANLVSLSPLILPVVRYDFSSASTLRASESLAFSEGATLTGSGQLQGSTSLSFTATGNVVFGRILGSTSLSFTANATYSTQLRANESLSFSANATPSALANILGSTDLTFQANASFIGKAQTRLSPIVLPTTRVNFGNSIQTSKGSTSFSFTTDSTLTAKGGLGGNPIRGSTSINLFAPAYLWLVGKGELKGSGSITFGESATLRAEGAALGSTSITFDATANLRGGISNLQGATSLGFTNSGDVKGKGQLQSSESLTFSQSATILATGELKGATVIRFLNPGMLISPVFGSVTLSFTAQGTLREKTPTTIAGKVLFQPGANAGCRFQDDAVAQIRYTQGSVNVRFAA